jgi:hypothetical protein
LRPIQKEYLPDYQTVTRLVEAELMVGKIAVSNRNILRIDAFKRFVNERADLLISREKERIEKAETSLEPL